MSRVSSYVSIGLVITIFAPSTAVLGADLLIPFQGLLTDSNGGVIEGGVKQVQFKLYDSPVGGEVKWAGEIHQLSVNEGRVNTVLGTKTGFSAEVSFLKVLYLDITVDANDDGRITAADPPLLPRQVIVPPASSIQVNEVVTGIREDLVLAERVVSIAKGEAGALIGTGLVPIGSILPFAGGGVPPTGWEYCDGAARSSGDYSELFKVIGTSWGSAPNDPGKDFNLPDMRGMFLRGADRRGRSDSNGVDPDRPRSVGGERQEWQIARHSHVLETGAQLPADRNLNRDGFMVTNVGKPAGNHYRPSTLAEVFDARTGEPIGGEETRPVNVAVNFIIRVR